MRDGLTSPSVAYEQVVGVVEREFGPAAELHLALAAREQSTVAFEHTGQSADAEETVEATIEEPICIVPAVEIDEAV